MPSVDPQLFTISRPRLDRYRAVTGGRTIVETYLSEAGHMVSCGGLQRISLNLTPHRRYAHRTGANPFRRVDRHLHSIALQPAGVRYEVEGDAAAYVSVFQPPELHRAVGGQRLARGGGEVFCAVADPTTLSVILALASAADDGEHADALLIEHLGIGLACRAAKLFGATMPEAKQAPLSRRRLGRVVDYVESRLGDRELRVEDLAAVARLSAHHFARAFKRATGVAPHRFVIDRRVARARLLLTDDRQSLAAVAHATGFSSQAHFSTLFRRSTGMTPGRYRQSVRT